jgi:hypothetical protein
MTDLDQRSSRIEDGGQRAELRIKPIRPWPALAALLLIFLTPGLYRPTLQGKLPFDGRILDEMNARRADYVFIGNSMLGTRIDEATLETRLGKNCCYILWTGGAESAWEHQALKNEVIPAVRRPKVVFVFFRDTYLTQVTYRSNDAYGWKIERLSHDDEPELTRAMRASRTWQEQLEYDLGLFYPIQKRREAATYALEWLASLAAGSERVPFGMPVASDYNEMFEFGRMKNIEAADDSAAARDARFNDDFDARLPYSLLPSMINLARQAGTTLVFVRVQRRPTLQGQAPQNPQLLRYVAKLRAYLIGNGAGFYDFTGDPELTLDHYLDGDHIRPDWKAESTELFLRRLQAYFK